MQPNLRDAFGHAPVLQSRHRPHPVHPFRVVLTVLFVLTFAGLAKKQESRWSDSANDAPDEICECIAESLPSNKTLIMRKIARI